MAIPGGTPIRVCKEITKVRGQFGIANIKGLFMQCVCPGPEQRTKHVGFRWNFGRDQPLPPGPSSQSYRRGRILTEVWGYHRFVGFAQDQADASNHVVNDDITSNLAFSHCDGLGRISPVALSEPRPIVRACCAAEQGEGRADGQAW